MLKRTSTGILSNRRPVEGTPATSGSTTPNAGYGLERLNLISTAKRDAAKRGLYSRFFRGPVLGPESIAEEEQRLASLLTQTPGERDVVIKNPVTKHIPELESMTMEVKVIGQSIKKRELKEDSHEGAGNEGEEARRRRKRRRKEDRRKKKNAGRLNPSEARKVVSSDSEHLEAQSTSLSAETSRSHHKLQKVKLKNGTNQRRLPACGETTMNVAAARVDNCRDQSGCAETSKRKRRKKLDELGSD